VGWFRIYLNQKDLKAFIIMTRKTLFTALCLILLILVPFPFLRGQSIQGPLRIGVASMITPLDSVKYYQDIVDYISKKMGVPAEMVHRRTYDEMDRMLEKGKVDAAFICSAPYVKDKRQFGVELLVAPVVNGEPLYYSYIIVHKDSNIRDVSDLKDKVFAFMDPKSNSGKLYPEYYLLKNGIKPEEFFENYMYSYSHNKSVELVAKKVVDAAAVESPVYEYMKKKNSPYVLQTRIIHKSPPFGVPPLVISKDVSTFVKEKLREILTGMHNDPEGKRILEAMLIDKFVVVPDSNYDSIRDMESFVSQVRGTKDAEQKPDNTVYFGVIPRDNPRIAYEKYQPLMDYLSEHSFYRYELVLENSYEDTVNALGRGDINVALLGSLTYLEAHKEFGAMCILKGITVDGEPFDRSVIVTGEKSGIKSIRDIKGKSFAFASTKSTSGNLVPRYMLAEHGIHLSELKEYKNFDYHDSVVKWILRGRYDAGAVRKVVADRYLPLGLRIIAVSEPIPTAPVVIGPKTPYVIVEDVKSLLLHLKNTDDGQAVLEKLDPGFRGGFVEARDNDYEGIRKMINDVPKTCGLGCHPKIRL
jgi:phosphonate transport system substrate-binding protein